MKKFDTPRMERIDLVRQNIMATSGCYENYCDGYTCPQCDDQGYYCDVQSPCSAQKCGHYQCLTY